MAGFTGIKDVVDAQLNGQYRDGWWRKFPSQVTTAGIWFDLATTSGSPKAKNWFDAAPLVAAQVKQSTDGGIYHGKDVSPQQMHLRKTMTYQTTGNNPMQMILCDYLLYYPTIDDSEPGLQEMDNTNTLPRYTDGLGVQMMAVTLAGRTGGQTFTVTYTNSDGTPGRTSQTVAQNTSGVIGTITTTFLTVNAAGSASPFIGLQHGDKGVRSVESVQMNGADTGLFALVLVKPIAETQANGNVVPTEVDYLMHRNELPRIYDDAYLNYVCLPQSSLASQNIIGNVKTIYN